MPQILLEGTRRQTPGYCSDVSADDSIFDLLAVTDETQYDQSFVDYMSNFDLNGFYNDSDVVCSVIDGGDKDVISNNEVGVGDDNDSSVLCSVIDDDNKDVSSGNEVGVGGDNDSDVVCIDIDDGTDDVRIDIFDDAGDVMENRFDGAGEVIIDNVDGIDSVRCDDADGIVLGDDLSDSSEAEDAGDDYVIISSDDDDGIMAISNERVVTVTFVMTFRKTTRYIHGGITNTKVTVEKGCFVHSQ